jgi:hypothetical protein
VLLDARLDAVIEVVSEAHNSLGKNYTEARLVSEDGQALHLYEGQLKEVPGARLEVGRRYRVTLRPFLNNRWVELKVVKIEPEA